VVFSSINQRSSSIKIVRRLCKIAQTSAKVARCRVVAALVRRNKILAVGVNSYASVRLARRYSKHELAQSTHAEVAAIHEFLRRYDADGLRSCTLYVCRILNDGTTALAKPCRGCEAAIKAFGIKEVCYSE